MPLILALVAAMVAFRLFPHPENFAPIGAFALIAGFHLGKRYALWVPFAVLFVSDLVLNHWYGYAAFHWPRLIDWAAFLLIGLGALAVRERSWKPKLALTFATPFFFYGVSNFGVWLTGLNLAGLPYAKNLAGLAECYVAGLPFLRGTVLGDWGFVALFTLVMHLATRSERVPAVASTKS